MGSPRGHTTRITPRSTSSSWSAWLYTFPASRRELGCSEPLLFHNGITRHPQQHRRSRTADPALKNLLLHSQEPFDYLTQESPSLPSKDCGHLGGARYQDEDRQQGKTGRRKRPEALEVSGQGVHAARKKRRRRENRRGRIEICRWWLQAMTQKGGGGASSFVP